MPTEKSNSPFPILAITLGDPAGIGPEIVLKALKNPVVFQQCRPLVVGDLRILQRAAKEIGIETGSFEVLVDPSSGTYQLNRITMIDLGNALPDSCPVGHLSSSSGKAAVEYVLQACDLAMQGQVDAIVTAPLNKEAINLAGFHYAGHTEILTEHTHASNVSMLLVGPNLRVVHVSTHVALEEAIRRVSQK